MTSSPDPRQQGSPAVRFGQVWDGSEEAIGPVRYLVVSSDAYNAVFGADRVIAVEIDSAAVYQCVIAPSSSRPVFAQATSHAMLGGDPVVVTRPDRTRHHADSVSTFAWSSRRGLIIRVAIQVNVQEATSRLSQLLVAAEQGEEVVIARDGKPVARLVPVTTPPPRSVGFVHGAVRDSFSDPLPDDELARWS